MTNKITIVILALVALVVGALLWVTLGGDPVPERKPARAKKTFIQDAAPTKDVAKAKGNRAAADKWANDIEEPEDNSTESGESENQKERNVCRNRSNSKK